MLCWVGCVIMLGELLLFVVEVVCQFYGFEWGIVSLVLFVDCVWFDVELDVIDVQDMLGFIFVDVVLINVVEDVLCNVENLYILLGFNVCLDDGLEVVGCFVEVIGVKVFMDIFIVCIVCGYGCFVFKCLSYFGVEVMEEFKDVDFLIVVGMKVLVVFFVYFGEWGEFVLEGILVVLLGGLEGDIVVVFVELVNWFDVFVKLSVLDRVQVLKFFFDVEFNLGFVGILVMCYMFEDSIICDDVMILGMGVFLWIFLGLCYDWLCLIGGFLGFGML